MFGKRGIVLGFLKRKAPAYRLPGDLGHHNGGVVLGTPLTVWIIAAFSFGLGNIHSDQAVVKTATSTIATAMMITRMAPLCAVGQPEMIFTQFAQAVYEPVHTRRSARLCPPRPSLGPCQRKNFTH